MRVFLDFLFQQHCRISLPGSFCPKQTCLYLLKALPSMTSPTPPHPSRPDSQPFTGP